ncbi:MAG: ATP-binding protein [Bacteroidia bacterium]
MNNFQNSLKKIILFATCTFFAVACLSAKNLDSLEQVFRKGAVDLQSKMDLCDKLGLGYVTTDNDKAKYYARQGLDLAQTLGDKIMLARFNRCIGASFTMEGRYDSAEVYLNQARTILKPVENKETEALIDLSFGTLYTRQKKYDEAIANLFSALKIFEKVGDKLNSCLVLGNIAATYMYQHSSGLAEKYYIETKKLALELHNFSMIGQANTGLSKIYLEKGNNVEGLLVATEAIRAYQKSGEIVYESVASKELASIYLDQKQIDSAEVYGQKALLLAQKTGIKRYVVNALVELASIKFVQNQVQRSIEYSLNAMKTDTSDIDDKASLFANLARCYIQTGNKQLADKYFKRFRIILEDQMNENYRNSISEMEVRYQTEKKQAEIERLTLIERQRTLIIYILIASLLLGTVLGWMQFRNIRNKKIIADQKLEIKEKQLLELEKERQLTAARSVLQGEEAERSRLAGDLHDGLGGMLTGVKLKLSFMKENAIITSENLAHFNHALDLLDTSITEMRRVAHNLMPETLMHYGLRTALNDFIKQVAPEGLPVIRLNTFGEDLRYEKEIEITLYRITQELTTNALKHAHARQIDIQLFTEKDRICIQVIDNGIGFDPEKLDPSKTGAGLKNIHDRVTAFGGKFEIISHPEKGTESLIEFMI